MSGVVDINGHHLDGTGATVLLTNDRFQIEQEVAVDDGASSTAAPFTVPDLPVGFYQVALRVIRPGESEPRTSNQLALDHRAGDHHALAAQRDPRRRRHGDDHPRLSSSGAARSIGVAAARHAGDFGWADRAATGNLTFIVDNAPTGDQLATPAHRRHREPDHRSRWPSRRYFWITWCKSHERWRDQKNLERSEPGLSGRRICALEAAPGRRRRAANHCTMPCTPRAPHCRRRRRSIRWRNCSVSATLSAICCCSAPALRWMPSWRACAPSAQGQAQRGHATFGIALAALENSHWSALAAAGAAAPLALDRNRRCAWV